VLQGNGLYWDDPAGAAEAKRLFERAIEIDPKYGLAYALLATMTRQKWRDDDSGNSNALLDEAYTLAMRAVELDDGDSTCHSLLAQVCLYRRSFELALEHMQRSMALNPNNQWNAADMGLILVYLGRADEALAWNQRARQIDPYFDQPWYWRQSGVTCMVLNRYEDALKLFARHPIRKYYIAAYMAGCHARLGDLEHARASVAECLALKPDFSVRRWMAKEPFKLEADAARIEESLRLAGLPD
jgi:tetratricopeptide (TPR) repeat protein